jgi:holo-[acyl-carrier protein] synthase
MMITGVGVDIIPIERFSQESNREGFLEQILTEEELLRTPKGDQRDAFCARIFATKEAVLKALGCGLHSGFRWRDISVTEGPEVHLSGWLRSFAEGLSMSRIHVSHSSSNTHAVAFVLFETNNSRVTQ